MACIRSALILNVHNIQFGQTCIIRALFLPSNAMLESEILNQLQGKMNDLKDRSQSLRGYL